MSHDHNKPHSYDPNCTGCKPALVDARTGKIFADDSPEMQAVTRAWEASTPEEREAFHDVTCESSFDPAVVAKSQMIAQRISAELAKIWRVTSERVN